MDERVRAKVQLELWASRYDLHRAESRRAEIPAGVGSGNSALSAARRVKEARKLVEGWEYVVSLLDPEPADDVDAGKEFPA